MTDNEIKLRTGEAVRVPRPTYKALKNKSNDLCQEKDRMVPIGELITWLVDNHLDDFPMDLCAKRMTK